MSPRSRLASHLNGDASPASSAGGACRAGMWRTARRALRGGVLGGALAALILLGGPDATHRLAPLLTPLATPELQAQLPEVAARARYERAREDFDALQREGEQLSPRVQQATRTLQNYQAAGNQRAARDVFFNEFIVFSDRLTAVNVRSSAAKFALDEARRDLLRVLRARETGYLAELNRVPPPSRIRQAELNRLIVEIRQEENRLEREREPIAEVGFRPVPDYQIFPTDGPADLRAKADFLEKLALDYGSAIALVDEEIRVREQSALVRRTAQDSRAAITRFDGDRPPGTGPGARTGAGQAADGRAGDARSEELTFAELPLAEQIERLKSVRMQAEEARSLALERAGVFRTRALERGGPR